MKNTRHDLEKLHADEAIDFESLKANNIVGKYKEWLDNTIENYDIRIVGYPKSEECCRKNIL